MKRLEMIPEREYVNSGGNKIVTLNVTLKVTQLYANVLKL